ncbi:MAG TPA: class I SAM-dependent methyltransferase [Burkholderiales bacterium]|nr:class I SAM-dependent methyltransferase [Burkholderiales bacterium]
MGDINQRLFLTRSMPRTDGPVLEVGSRDYGNTENFRDVYAQNEYVGVDLSAGKNVDRVIDLVAGVGELPEGHFALAICCSVLEHVRRPWDMAGNLTRLLRPGGAIYIAVPWVWRYHAYPDDYFRFSWRGIAELFPGIAWTRLAYSTNVAHEFFDLSRDAAPPDDTLIAFAPTPAGPQRQYLPYLQVHMLGTK